MTAKPVLVVDDEPDARGLVSSMLVDAGHVVVEISSGAAALDYLVSRDSMEPWLIVLDLQMPGMTGWEFITIVKRYHRLASIPIVVVSGAEPTRASLDGVAGYFAKPPDAPAFVAKVAGLRGAPART